MMIHVGGLATTKYYIFIGEKNRHQNLTGFLALILAATPLLAGALIIEAFPTKLGTAGPLLISTVGLNLLATVIGAFIVAISTSTILLKFCLAVWLLNSFHSVLNEPADGGPNPLLEPQWRNATESQRSRCGELFFERIAHGSATKTFPPDPSAAAVSKSSSKRQPLFVVSGEGGGLRAAYWTALNLQQLETATAGQFSDRLNFLSGVSGSSLGIAAWIGSQELALSNEGRMQMLQAFFSEDFLTPLVGGLLFLDAPRIFFGNNWPSSRRDQIFEKAIAERWREMTGSEFFYTPLNRMCLKKRIKVVFNAMDALTGDHIKLANDVESFDVQKKPSLSIVEAVHMSARFPFLSPGGETVEPARTEGDAKKYKDGKVRSAVLVDGGYLDNSGLMASNQHVQELRDGGYFEQNLVFLRQILLVNDPAQSCVPVSQSSIQALALEAREIYRAAPFPYKCERDLANLNRSLRPRAWQWLSTPIEAMLSAREAHAEAVRRKTADLFILSLSNELSSFRSEYNSKSAQLLSNLNVRRAEDSDSVSEPIAYERLECEAGRDAEWLENAELYRKARSKPISADQLSPNELGCVEVVEYREPPLGWILGDRDRQLLGCLSKVAVARADILQPRNPGTSSNERQVSVREMLNASKHCKKR
jgi:hypothetical protein